MASILRPGDEQEVDVSAVMEKLLRRLAPPSPPPPPLFIMPPIKNKENSQIPAEKEFSYFRQVSDVMIRLDQTF